MKVALVHDYLNQYGGAERVLEAIADLFPGAPIYTSIYDPELMKGKFAGHKIHTSFMQHFPGVLNHHQAYLLFYPAAFESFNLSKYDLVISSSSAWAKGVRTRSDAIHICYCHAPMRFAWDTAEYTQRERMGKAAKVGLPVMMGSVRLWDIASAARPDYIVANSKTIAGRIREYWNRESVVINPPVEVDQIPYYQQQREDFYLTTARLVPYKRIDVAVQAFKMLDLPLKIVGTGRDLDSLKQMAGPKTEFLGYLPDEELREMFGRCRAFIQTGAEDFGITQIEAMAGGAPVIAINQYGPAEVNMEGLTGVLFDEQTPESLASAVRRFEQIRPRMDSDFIRNYAESFGRDVFMDKFANFVDNCLKESRVIQPATFTLAPIPGKIKKGWLNMPRLFR